MFLPLIRTSFIYIYLFILEILPSDYFVIEDFSRSFPNFAQLCRKVGTQQSWGANTTSRDWWSVKHLCGVVLELESIIMGGSTRFISWMERIPMALSHEKVFSKSKDIKDTLGPFRLLNIVYALSIFEVFNSAVILVFFIHPEKAFPVGYFFIEWRADKVWRKLKLVKFLQSRRRSEFDITW